MVSKSLWTLGVVVLASPALAMQTQYEISFEARWTSDLPRPSSAHFTQLVGATHNNSASLFDVGASASPGVEQVAETGGTSIIRSEINSLIATGRADRLVLGTDGFGRSDSRVNVRRFFEVDANHIAAAAMVDLYREGAVKKAELEKALKKYDIDGGKPNPRLV